MNVEMRKVLTVIGVLQKQIAGANTLREAMKAGLQTIQDNFPSDEIILWYHDSDAEDTLHPYYWLGDRDFTACAHKIGSGIVGRVYASQHAERHLEYRAGTDNETEADFLGLSLRSVLCVPFSSRDENLGCVQLVRENSRFTEEIADIVEILVDYIAITIEDNDLLQRKWNFTEVLLRAKDIMKSYRSGDTVTKVLQGINLDLYRGEFLAVLGESGCGKSTLLNILGGLEELDGGSILYQGQELANASEQELTDFRRAHIGYIFQSYNLMPNLTTKQNLDLIGELVPDPMDAEQVLSLVGLSDKRDSYPSQLSGGQQQRVSIARALVKRPQLIFADEPTAALDYATSIEVLRVFENIIKTGITLVMVTHNEEITKMADRVVRLRNGKVHEIVINRHRLHADELVW